MCALSSPTQSDSTTYESNLDINNVGVIARALYIHSNPDYDEVEAFKWQNTQVTMLSIGSFSSRLVIGNILLLSITTCSLDVSLGFVADLVRTQLHAPRSYCLCIVSMLFIISQIIAIGVSTVNTLWIASALVGAAYGSLLAIVVTIIADWFGLGLFTLFSHSFYTHTLYSDYLLGFSSSVGKFWIRVYAPFHWREPLVIHVWSGA